MWELVAITQLSGFNAMIVVIDKCDKKKEIILIAKSSHRICINKTFIKHDENRFIFLKIDSEKTYRCENYDDNLSSSDQITYISFNIKNEASLADMI